MHAYCVDMKRLANISVKCRYITQHGANSGNTSNINIIIIKYTVIKSAYLSHSLTITTIVTKC